MSNVRNKPVSGESRPSEDVGDGSPLRVFVIGAIVIIVVIAALLTAIRVFLFPVWEANSEGAHQVATAQVQLSAAMTQEALTPMPSSTVAAAVTPQPTIAPTAVSANTPAPAVAGSESGPLPASTGAQSPVPTAARTDLPTPTTEQAAEIAVAYKNYFDVTGDALLNLDPTSLGDVAAGAELDSLRSDIQNDKAQGRALQTNVQHEQVYVLDIQDDQADVADRYRDSSIYVDAQTRMPLPGQVAPAAPDVAPAVSVIYHLQRLDGTWKVVSGQRFVPQRGQ
jgi:hypothetical protein